MKELNQKYDREQFLGFLKEIFLSDFQKDIRPVGVGNLTAINKANTLGSSPSLDLQVFEFEYSGSFNKRIALAKEAFQLMKQSATFQALAVFYSEENEDWRFSLMTANPQRNDKGNITVAYSNPRRYSFFLGPNAKVNTPTKFLIKKGMVVDFNDLKSRFSLEVVNKEFYKEISDSFTKLVGGTRGEGRNKKTYESLLRLPSVSDHSQTSIEFAVRLIGRIIFCWFLREKISKSGSPLMPKELFSLGAISSNPNYYHAILEPIFFEVLNKPAKSRKDDFAKEPFSFVPYLNGGLFSPQDDDYYKRTNGDIKSQHHETLVIPDSWFKDFFEILETYNFTIDENTSYDEELSIDPEMLGRIFENLLAEINPETGESARRSTGSYYTPRIIVNYMVDESLLLYLKKNTGINEEKLRVLISFDLNDDLENPTTLEQKEEIVNALEKIKILDPACGSGAFPIGILQKIIFILQQIDPDGQLWFKKQQFNKDPEFRRFIESKFTNNELDFIRKIGVIKNCIYGVDIQPIATEISRLRCFLTLIVDEMVNDEAENRGIQPLPNLDFKFLTANSLVGLPKSQGLFSELEDREGIESLKWIRDEYFTSSEIERANLISNFYKTQKEIGLKLEQNGGHQYAETSNALRTWDPFVHNSTSWFDPEWMFGIRDGFDIVIGNPPWEKFKPLDPEFFERYYSDYRELSKDDQKNKKNELLINPEISIAYEEYLGTYKKMVNYFKKRYILQGSSDLNLYKLFLERSYSISKIVALLIPGQITVDQGAKDFREKFFLDNSIVTVIGFSNKDGLFPAIDNNQKFVVFLLDHDNKNTGINILGWISEFKEFHNYKLVQMSKTFFENFDENKTIFLDTGKSLEILMKMNDSLGTSSLAKLNYHYWREYDVTNDAHYFNDNNGKYLLFSGKAIGQYDCMSKSWIEKHGRSSLWKNAGFPKKEEYRTEYFVNEIPNRITEHHATENSQYRIVVQTVTGAINNTRTLYSAILPKKYLTNNSLGNLFIGRTDEELIFYSAVLNSFVVDWQARLKVATNLNKFILDTMLVPIYEKVSEDKKRKIIQSALSLSAVSEDFDDLTKKLLGKNYLDVLIDDEQKRQLVKNELDSMVSDLFNLDKDELEFILGTFPIVDRKIKESILSF